MTNTKAQHTPGPWNVTPKTTSFGISITKNGRSVATIGGNTNTPYEQSMADARLIAAAPELLEALELLLNLADFDCMDDKSNEWRSTMIDARAAIAKATGN